MYTLITPSKMKELISSPQHLCNDPQTYIVPVIYEGLDWMAVPDVDPDAKIIIYNLRDSTVYEWYTCDQGTLVHKNYKSRKPGTLIRSNFYYDQNVMVIYLDDIRNTLELLKDFNEKFELSSKGRIISILDSSGAELDSDLKDIRWLGIEGRYTPPFIEYVIKRFNEAHVVAVKIQDLCFIGVQNSITAYNILLPICGAKPYLYRITRISEPLSHENYIARTRFLISDLTFSTFDLTDDVFEYSRDST